MPLKHRFVWLFSSVVILLLASFAAGIYFFVKNETLQSAERNLVSLIDHEWEHLELPNLTTHQGMGHFHDVYVRIRKQGLITYDSFPADVEEPSQSGIRGNLLYHRIKRAHNGHDHEISAYYDLSDTYAYFSLLRRSLLIGMLTALAVTIPLSLLFTSYLLSPFRKIARLTSKIDSQDLSFRFAVPKSRDELALLATNFNAMLSKLDASFEHIRRFSSQVSHELRTPLAVMVSQTEYLLRKPRSELELARIHLLLLTKARDLGSIVEKMLALSEVERLDKLQDIEPVVVENCVREQIDTLRVAYSSCHREITFRSDIPNEISIQVNRALLQTVLKNVLENAIKFAVCRIEIAYFHTDQGVLLRVEDDGPGISEEQRDKALEHLVRLKGAPIKAEGHGIGLSIVKACVDAMQCSLKLGKSKWGGLAIDLSFPLSTRSEPHRWQVPQS